MSELAGSIETGTKLRSFVVDIRLPAQNLSSGFHRLRKTIYNILPIGFRLSNEPGESIGDDISVM